MDIVKLQIARTSLDEIKECFNCRAANVLVEDGRWQKIWIQHPQQGHWLNEDEIECLGKFIAVRR